MLGCLSLIGRPPLRQIHTAAVLIRLPPPDYTVMAPIRPQLRRSATTEAAVRSIDHSDVAAV
jgi:hypothetical protein